MHKPIKVVSRKLINTAMDSVLMTEMLLSPQKLPEYEEANEYLHTIAPDAGGSCLVEREREFDMRSILLSVIVPAYNVEKYIVNCLDSILGQDTPFDYEIIVINDGSTDGTPALLAKYESNKKVRILHQDNQGLSAARNVGIACSKGKYLCFVDSDDELSPDSLGIMINSAEISEAKLVIGSINHCFRDGTVRYTTRLNDQKVESQRLPGFACGCVIHYSVFQRLCFPVGYWFEDSIMAQIIHPLCRDAMYTTSQICYRYFLNENGITALAHGKTKSLDSLWITMRLLKEREFFGLVHTQQSYEYFLRMVNLTYRRTKKLGVQVAQSVFVVQCMLLKKYYDTYQSREGSKYSKIEKALRARNFRKYVLACESRGA